MTIGESILELLKKEISEVEYKRYIKQLTFSTEDSKTDYALFLAPNPLVASWVRTKYSEKIAHLFEIKTSPARHPGRSSTGRACFRGVAVRRPGLW